MAPEDPARIAMVRSRDARAGPNPKSTSAYRDAQRENSVAPSSSACRGRRAQAAGLPRQNLLQVWQSAALTGSHLRDAEASDRAKRREEEVFRHQLPDDPQTAAEGEANRDPR
jgi:hypothetical protein